MVQEDKELLFKDLCARLPYGLKCKIDLDMLLETFPEYGARLSYAATSTGIDLHAKVGERIYTLFGIPSKYRLYFLELDDFFDEYGIPVECVKPYLRPMSSMTKEEKLHVELTYGFFYHDGVLDNVHIFEAGGTYDRDGNYEPPCEYRQEKHVTIEQVLDFIHWLNEHYFDYRGLIEKGLALEAPEGMYN